MHRGRTTRRSHAFIDSPPAGVRAALLLALGGASLYLASAKADDATTAAESDTVATGKKHKPSKRQVREASKQAQKTAGTLTASPSASGAHDLILGSKDSAQPREHGAVPDRGHEGRRRLLDEDVQGLRPAGARVSYKWIPAGQTAASACGDEDGTLGDSAAAYCSGDDTIYISEKFATDIYNGALDQALPGSSQGYGRTVGDFSVAYIVAHEYGASGPGRARPLREVRTAAPDHGVRAPGRLLRRHVGQERLPGEPSRGR